MTNQQNQRPLRRLAGGVVALTAGGLLAGCLSDSSEPDAGDSDSVQVSGLAVDGYIAGGRVYADFNDNNRRDSFEPRAFTDSFGFFSYRPEIRDGDGTLVAEERDYCAEGVTRHCLRIPPTQAEVRLRVSGGYDLFAGEAFEGEVSRQILVPNSDSRTVLAISPETTVKGPLDGRQDLWGDYFDADDFRADDAVAAVEMHQTMVLLSQRAVEEADADGLEAELTGVMYDQVRERTKDEDDFAEAWYGLEQQQIEEAVNDGLDSQDLSDRDLAKELAEYAIDLRETLRDGDDPESLDILGQAGGNRDRAEGRIQAVLAYTGSRPLPGEVDRDADRKRIADLAGQLGEPDFRRDSVDLGALTEVVREARQQDKDVPADAAEGAVVDAVYPELAGTYISVNYGDSNADGNVALFFEGEPGNAEPGDHLEEDSGGRYAQGGPLTLCVRGDVGELDFSDFIDQPGDAVRLNGEWGRPNDRTLILTLSAFSGSFEETASLRLRRGPDENTWALSLDYDGSRETFEADRASNDFEPIGDLGVPDDQQQCTEFQQ